MGGTGAWGSGDPHSRAWICGQACLLLVLGALSLSGKMSSLACQALALRPKLPAHPLWASVSLQIKGSLPAKLCLPDSHARGECAKVGDDRLFSYCGVAEAGDDPGTRPALSPKNLARCGVSARLILQMHKQARGDGVTHSGLLSKRELELALLSTPVCKPDHRGPRP